jgi:type VI secretion system protein VasG
MTTPLKTLISKLNPLCRTASERTANLCVARGNYEVDLEHVMLALLEQTQSDFCVVAKRSGVSLQALEADIHAEIGRFKTGNARTPVFSPYLPKLFEHAWLIASLDEQITHIRSGHLLLALLCDPELSQLARRSSALFANFTREELKHDFAKLTAGSQEAEKSVRVVDQSVAQQSEDVPAQGWLTQTPALDQFTTNLTKRAREGHLDPVIGRDTEIRQAIDILMRRRQNNPILTGEAGVGKTAVVEGLALRIAKKDVPPPLLNVDIHTLDMGLLQAGASVKGEFENRLKNVISEVKKSPHPIILFIDEAHTLIGAGGQAGQNDAANLLKPALARGELRTIAATTWSEYKKYVEKDAALARRFQVIKIEEPSEEIAISMLRGMVPLMEKHFNVRVLDEAIAAAVRLSHRYMSGRQLPDKAVSVLDTACAKVALGQNATPAAIEETKKALERLEAETVVLQRESLSGSKHLTRLKEIHTQRELIQQKLTLDEARLTKEIALVEKIQALRNELENTFSASNDNGKIPSKKKVTSHENGHGENTTPGDKSAMTALSPNLSPRGGEERSESLRDFHVKELEALRKQLKDLQDETPMVPLDVDAIVVAEIIASWTGIPLGRMVKDEIHTVRNLLPLLAERVINQDHALDAIAQRVRTARANLEDPNKPKGVFLFVGPSGVGKTETALALADVLYGGEHKIITINMSEYQEAQSVSGLKGSPPGYVGYGEGGVLTEAVRRHPYSVVLLDEVEKAHPDVLELFFQVFDKGVLDDAEGREIDFRNTLIILTSNVGSAAIMQACLNKSAKELPTPQALAEMIYPQLHKAFKPAFLGRMKVIPYYPIPDDALATIIELKLGRIQNRIAQNHQANFSWDEALVDAVLARCTEVDSGARHVDHILNGSVLPEIADTVLSHMAEGKAIQTIRVTAAKNGNFKYKVA